MPAIPWYIWLLLGGGTGAVITAKVDDTADAVGGAAQKTTTMLVLAGMGYLGYRALKFGALK